MSQGMRRDNDFISLILTAMISVAYFCEQGLARSMTGEKTQRQATVVEFQPNSYEFSERSKQSLASLVQTTASLSHAFVSIHENTEGLLAWSPLYLLEKSRTLRVFQFLVQNGIAPEKIGYELTKTEVHNDELMILTSVEDSGKNFSYSRTKAQTEAEKVQQEKTDVRELTDVMIEFSSGSVKLTQKSKKLLEEVIATLSELGHKEVVIEGFTDTVGGFHYNKLLGELRALSVYEYLARAGVSSERIVTQSFGETKAKVKGDSARDRLVVIRWQQQEAIADYSPKRVYPSEAEKDTPAVVGKASLFDLVPFAGLLVPAGELSSHAVSGAYYGLGVGKAFVENAKGEFRITLFASNAAKLEAKEKDRSGPLSIQVITLRADGAFGPGPLRPFLGLGLSQYSWDATIVEPSTTRSNTGKKNDFGGLITLGLDYEMKRHLYLAPEFTYQRVGGDFAESLVTAVMSLRWRI